MKFSEYETFFSQPRMARFLTATANDLAKAKKLYRANLLISESFLPLLSAFEVCLRNQLNTQLCSHFRRHDWILVEKSGFMMDPCLRPRFELRSQVTRAESKLAGERRTISNSTVLAEQSFGFWVSLFEPSHFRLLRGIPILIFPYKPRTTNRRDLLNALHRIRRFRNRIYHNEPICFDRSGFSLTLAKEALNDLKNLSAWIDPNFHSWMLMNSRADRVIARQESMMLGAT